MMDEKVTSNKQTRRLPDGTADVMLFEESLFSVESGYGSDSCFKYGHSIPSFVAKKEKTEEFYVPAIKEEMPTSPLKECLQLRNENDFSCQEVTSNETSKIPAVKLPEHFPRVELNNESNLHPGNRTGVDSEFNIGDCIPVNSIKKEPEEHMDPWTSILGSPEKEFYVPAIKEEMPTSPLEECLQRNENDVSGKEVTSKKTSKILAVKLPKNLSYVKVNNKSNLSLGNRASVESAFNIGDCIPVNLIKKWSKKHIFFRSSKLGPQRKAKQCFPSKNFAPLTMDIKLEQPGKSAKIALKMPVKGSVTCVENVFRCSDVENSISAVRVKIEEGTETKSADCTVDAIQKPLRRSRRLGKIVAPSYVERDSPDEDDPPPSCSQESKNLNKSLSVIQKNTPESDVSSYEDEAKTSESDESSSDSEDDLSIPRNSTSGNQLGKADVYSPAIDTLIQRLEKYLKTDKCLLCGFVLRDRLESAVKEHLLTHINTEKCTIELDNSCSLNLIQPLDEYFKNGTCLLCGFVSNNERESAAVKHLLTHIKGKIYECKGCNKSFATPTLLSMHKATVTCSECGKVLASHWQLVRHKRTHAKKSYSCSFCNVFFRKRFRLKNHLRIHTGELPFSCETCSKQFRTRKSYMYHCLTHNEDKKYVCDICDQGFNSSAIFRDHQNIHKGNKELLTCDICQKVFNCRPNLLQHKRIHSDARKYECEMCDAKFKFPHHLKNHLLTHKDQ